jgi:hypothetical protein
MGEYFNFDNTKLVPYIEADAMDSLINFPIYSILLGTVAQGQSLYELSRMVQLQRKLFPAQTIPRLSAFSEVARGLERLCELRTLVGRRCCRGVA